jgi:hypothetical protein
MVLLSLNLDSLGLFIRVWLWISVPMSVFVLLWATWMNYRVIPRHQGGLKLAIEGWEGQDLPGGEGLSDGRGEKEPEGLEERVREGAEGEARERSDGELREGLQGKMRERSGGEGWDDMSSGKDAIYRGILWMKDKYEQYREQADRRYELLREELRRSEQRYQELMMSVQHSQDRPETVTDMRGEGERPARVVVATVAVGEAVRPAEESGEQIDLRSELDAKQLLLDELEAQLRVERLKTEELVIKLQGNSQLLLQVYQELSLAGKKLRIWEDQA